MKYSGESIVWIIIAVNCLIALVYMLIMRIGTKKKYVFIRGMIMLLCPVTASLCYLFSFVQDYIIRGKYVDYDSLSIDKTKMVFEKKIDKETELKTLPIEEVLTVAAAKDRREAMLNLLKTNVSGHLHLVRLAVENEDSETAHYAASVLTDIFGKFNSELSYLQAAYDKDRKNREINEEYIDAVLKILNSGALFGVEETRYLYIYTGLMENLNQNHPKAVTGEQCGMMVKALYKEGKSAQAEEWARMTLERWPDDEQSYLNVMYIEYCLGKKAEFHDIIRKLSESGIPLSRKGLDIVRFWQAG